MRLSSLLPIALVLLALLLPSCAENTDPSGPVVQDGELGVSLVAPLPEAGGAVQSVAFLDPTQLVAVIDGKIYTVPLASGAPALRQANTTYVQVMAGGGGEIYALSYDNLWVMADASQPPVKAPIVVRSGQVEKVMMSVGPDGQPYVRVFSYPPNMTVYTSTDRGGTWQTIPMPAGYAYGGGIAFGAPGTMYLSSPNGFYATTDAGTSWTTSPAPLANYGGELVRRSNGDILYYVPNGGGLQVSTDNGASFTELSPFNRYPFFTRIMEGAGGTLYAMITAGGNIQPDKVAQLMKSMDGGRTWKHVYFGQGYDFTLSGDNIVLGHSAATSGGIAISRDNGSTFAIKGLGTVQNVSSFGFDGNGALLLLADRTLFRKTSSGWQSLGGSSNFFTLATTPQGGIYLPEVSSTTYSTDGGTTWGVIAMPDYISGGIGQLALPVVLGLSNGEVLVSITTKRTDIYPGGHSNGSLVRVRPNGTATRIATSGNFTSIVQDADGKLYGRTENFDTFVQSTNNGDSWSEVPQGTPGYAFDSRNHYLASGELGTFRTGTLGSTTSATLKLIGFNSQSNYVSKVMFDRNDILHMLTSDQGLFVAAGKLP